MAVSLVASSHLGIVPNGVGFPNTITVPAGVTSSHLGIITFQSAGAYTSGTDPSIASWTVRVRNPAEANNSEVTVLTRKGAVAGDVLTVTATTNPGTAFSVDCIWLDTGGQDLAIIGTVGGRAGVAQSTNVIPGVTTTAANQTVLVLSGERTNTAGTTITGWSPSTPTQIYYLENSTTNLGTGTSYYLGQFDQAAAGATGTLTATYSGTGAGNGWGVLFGVASSVVSNAFTGSINLTGSGTLAATGVGSMPPVASLTWQSETATDTLSLGFMLSSGTSIRAVASLNSGLTSPVYGTYGTRPASGWVNSRVTGLAADTLYYTGVEVDGVLLSTGRGQYRTLKTGLVASKVIAGSCQYTGSTSVIFTRIKNEAPDFFVHMGDLHYADVNPYDDTAWRTAFRSSMTSSTFAPMLASVPMRYDPDNHDGPGTPSIGMGSTDPWAAAVSSAARELTGEVYAATTKGFYKTWVHAGVRYIEIDRWSFRSPADSADGPTKTMLGAAQKAWFLNLLQTATEPAIVVFAGFPNYSSLVGSGRWGSYPDERVEIGNAITALATAQRNKIVFIGGDSHTINADTGANAMWGRPSLNASPLDQAGDAASGTWDIANIDQADTVGAFSRLTFTPSGTNLNFTWDAVATDGSVLATWSTSFPTTVSYSGSLSLGASGQLAAVGSAPTVSAVTLALGGSGQLTASGTKGSTVWHFITPTEDIPILLEPRTHLYGAIRYGRAVWRIDGQWDQGLEPSYTIRELADRFYPGGRIHTITEAQRDELIAAGFGLYITPEEIT